MNLHQLSPLITILADGCLHSGAKLGEKLGITRSAVWKMLNALEYYGIEINRIASKGYQVEGGIEQLKQDKILAEFPHALKQQYVNKFFIFDEIDSTNQYLLEKLKQQPEHGLICLAEFQQRGRGRNGKHWFSPYGQNIYLSLLWRFEKGASVLTGLTLALGVGIVNVLAALGLDGLQLKWPNDVLYQGKKLAGVLTEVFIDSTGVCYAVIGIGINVKNPSNSDRNIDQPFTDLTSILNATIERNKLVGQLLLMLFSTLDQISQQGWQCYLPVWRQLDYLYQQNIVVNTVNSEYVGVAQGVTEDGSILVKIDDQVVSFSSGEVSLKVAS